MAREASETRVEKLLDLAPLYTLVPGAPAVELVAYYPKFRDYYRACEPQTKRWFVENARPNWRIFDIGANIGYYAILFSRLASKGRVWAFEPTETFRMLQRNLGHAQCANVTPMEVALGMQEGELAEDVYRIWGEDPERRKYAFSTVDRLVEKLGLDRLDCLKIDVDSFDFEVLRGSERTLERFDPWIVVELNHALARRGQSAAEALEWLAAHGYGEALVLDAENYVLRRRTQARKASVDRPSIELIFDARPVLFDDVLTKDKPLEGLFSNEPQLHNKATAEDRGEGGWRAIVPGPAWAYALSWRRVDSHSMKADSLLVEVDLVVSGAAVAIGCVNRDMSAFVGAEQLVEPSAARRTVKIAVEGARGLGHLVVRNGNAGGVTATVEIAAIRAYSAIPAT